MPRLTDTKRWLAIKLAVLFASPAMLAMFLTDRSAKVIVAWDIPLGAVMIAVASLVGAWFFALLGLFGLARRTKVDRMNAHCKVGIGGKKLTGTVPPGIGLA